MSIRQGEIYDVQPDGDERPYRVLITSGEDWNDAGVFPHCAEIIRPHNSREIPPYLLLLNPRTDSMGGLVVMESMAPIDPASLIERVGFVSGSTLVKLKRESLAKIFDL